MNRASVPKRKQALMCSMSAINKKMFYFQMHRRKHAFFFYNNLAFLPASSNPKSQWTIDLGNIYYVVDRNISLGKEIVNVLRFTISEHSLKTLSAGHGHLNSIQAVPV